MKTKIQNYKNAFARIFSSFDLAKLADAAQLVATTYANDKQILTAGNGGSAALAIHLAADFGKNVAGPNEKQPRILSLCCNTGTITALGNDCGFDSIFSFQLRNIMNRGDLVILISSSGNSPNIIKAAEFAKSNGATVLGMTGFNGGKLKEMADISLHVSCPVYELVEDAHSFFCHAIVHACKRVPMEIN
ncbi:MAG: D-sedoheptulose-7-phosphate isomerase [Thermoguttaceae bacterium]